MIISAGKEKVTSEKSFRIRFGETVTTSVSSAINPSDFSTCDEFIEAVKKTWEETWDDAYSEQGLPRPQALLPGAVAVPLKLAVPGLPRLNIIRICIVAAFILVRMWR